ncbi:MAG: TonB-dependent receptor [Prevotella sp.]|nr:TonB-dependent receptor [Prevotella sp.]
MRKHKLTRLAAILMLMLFSAVAYAQTVQVKGTVVDGQTQEPMIGLTVKEKGQSAGAVTNIDGQYTISVSLNATLVFTYMGYQTQEVALNGRNTLNVEMMPDVAQLDELVVIGYGVQKKSDITGSISSISGKDINSMPVSSTLQAMQGRAAGVSIIQNTGAPGSKTTIQIRGLGTVNDADPLYVVDGFIVDNIEYLNPNDIENIEVFKDAASSAVYGSRAANGVVAITTKSGKEGKVKITYDGYAGISNPWKTIDVMNADNYALMLDYINNTSNYSADGRLFMSRDQQIGEDANGRPIYSYVYDDHKQLLLDTIHNNSAGNYWDAITRTGFKMQHGVSVSGGTDKTQYLVSSSYYKENGIVKTSNYNRFNARVNVRTQLAKWLGMTANMAFTHDGRNGVPEGSSSVLKQALYENPMTYLYDNKNYWYSNNPLAVIDRYNAESHNNRLDMNLSLDARFLKYFDYQFKASYYTTHQIDDNFSEVWGLDEDFVMPTSLSQVYKYQNNIDKWEINNLLTFMWNDKNHNVTVLAGQTAEGYKSSYQQSYRRGTPSNEDVFHYLSSAYTGDKTYGLDREWTAIGFIGRLNYNFRETYLLQANVRADGSSKFAKGHKWGVFPSVSLGWRFTNEPFLRDIPVLSYGKLRVGWGKLGNNRIDELARYTYLSGGYNYPYGIGNHSLYEGSTAVVLGNPDIVWEKSESYNAGVDLTFFDNRLSLTVEYFNRKTTDMLLRVPTVSSVGLDSAPMTNAGAVKNYGWEYDVKWQDRIGKDWHYEVGFNLSWIKNKVTSLGTGNEPIWGSYTSLSISDYITKTAVGQPIGSFFGYVTDGIFQSFDEVRASAQYDYGKNDWEQTTFPGDFRFKDLNGDGRITSEDRTYLGSPLPKFIFGIPLAVGYKNIDLNIFFQGQTGNKVFNVMDYYLYNASNGNVYADLRDQHWSGQIDGMGREYFPLNTNASVPDLRSGDRNQNFRASDFFVHDGSYMRLKEMRVTYNFPQSILSRLKVNTLALSLTGYNLLTFTSYNGFDPEVGKIVGTESNNLSMGVDHGNYPQARSFTFGVKLGL